MSFSLIFLCFLTVLLALPILAFYNFLRASGARESGESGAFMARGMVFGVISTLLWGGVFFLYNRASRPGAQSLLTGCRSNCKNFATALEMYASDHGGHYPESLSRLTPNYLKLIPNCPAATSDTYSATYTYAFYSPDHPTPDAYTLHCQGHFHKRAGLPPDQPIYTSYSGLLDEPSASRAPQAAATMRP